MKVITNYEEYMKEALRILDTQSGIVRVSSFNLYAPEDSLTKEFVDDYYKAGGTGAYKEGNPTAGYYEDGVAKMAYKRIFIKHKEKSQHENNS